MRRDKEWDGLWEERQKDMEESKVKQDPEYIEELTEEEEDERRLEYIDDPEPYPDIGEAYQDDKERWDNDH